MEYIVNLCQSVLHATFISYISKIINYLFVMVFSPLVILLLFIS